jgi:single-strand DNA-binding protein
MSALPGSVVRGGDVQMTAHKAGQTAGAPDLVDDPGEPANEVRLRGRLAAAPRLRELPSGDTVWNLRVVVGRPPLAPGQERPRQRVDSLECAVWSGRLKSQVEKWDAGDLVEVTGALRRRFFRAGGTSASRVEVELTGGRRVRRAG